MFFFFNDPATTEIYTLSLPDALPIFAATQATNFPLPHPTRNAERGTRNAELELEAGSNVPRSAFRIPRLIASTICSGPPYRDRKSTRLNSSHDQISYAVFCLKKKTKD